MIGLNIAILEEFKSITNIDIQSYFQSVADFLSGPYSRIVAFYSGKEKEVSKGDFVIFNQLKQETEKMLSVFHIQSRAFSNLKFWLLLEQIEDVDSRLSSLEKINKWSKSSLTSFGYDPAQQALYTLREKQTLERVSSDILKTSEPTDDWVNIALTNQLTEEDYTPAGGITVQLSFPRINNGIDISSVVAVMVGEAICGLDFDKKLQFANDDLKVLSYNETVIQSIYTLANLRKNDNPDFPNQGLQSAIVVGANRASLNFPVITRQLSETFATDDSLKNFSLQSIEVKGDTLYISFQVQTRLNEIIDGTISV